MQVQWNIRRDGGWLHVWQGAQPLQQASGKFALGGLVGIPSA